MFSFSTLGINVRGPSSIQTSSFLFFKVMIATT